MKEDVDRRALNLGAGEPPSVIAAGKAHLERLARTSVSPFSRGTKGSHLHSSVSLHAAFHFSRAFMAGSFVRFARDYRRPLRT